MPARDSRPYHQRYARRHARTVRYASVHCPPVRTYVRLPWLSVWLKFFSCCWCCCCDDGAGEEGQDRREGRSAPAARVTVRKGASVLQVFFFLLHYSCGVFSPAPRKWIDYIHRLCSPRCCRPTRLLSCRRRRGTSSSCTSSWRSLLFSATTAPSVRLSFVFFPLADDVHGNPFAAGPELPLHARSSGRWRCA
jgi:hypothetical protein